MGYPLGHITFFKPIGIQTKETTMDSLSSFLFDLRADVIGSLDVDHISIIHDAPRLPSTSLINMNRRAMGMDDFQQPIFLKKERKEKNRWEVEGLLVRTKSCPDLAVQDPVSTTKSSRRPGLGSRQCSDSMLLRPRRQPDFPTELLTSEGIGGRTATRGHTHRWSSSITSCVSCVKEEVALPQANRAAASKSMTREDRRTLMTRHLSDSNLVMPTRCPTSPTKERTSSEVNDALVRVSKYVRPEGEKSRRYERDSLLQKQRSDIIEETLRTIYPEADGSTEQSSTQFLDMYSCSSTEFHRLQQSGIAAASQAETELNFPTSSAPTSISLTSNLSEEDIVLGDQTKKFFLACRNDSLVLLLKAEEARRSRAKNLHGQQSGETLVDHDVLLRRRAQGVRGKRLSEQMKRDRSVSSLMSGVSTLISEDAVPLRTTP
jgi:hypothetical protein